MGVTPSELLQYTEALAIQANKNELTERNILSKAYYACYHRSLESIPVKSVGKDIGMHRNYIEQLLQNGRGSIERKIGEKLKSLYSRRILADYLLTDNISHDAVPVQLYSARALFTLLESPPSPAESSVVVTLQRK